MTLKKISDALSAARKRAERESFVGFYYSILTDFGGRKNNDVLHCKDSQGKEFFSSI